MGHTEYETACRTWAKGLTDETIEEYLYFTPHEKFTDAELDALTVEELRRLSA